MREIIAKYVTYSCWKIPATVKLLSEEENNEANLDTPGSWGIKWDILYYLDENGEEQEIKPTYPAEVEWKRPDDIVDQDDGEEEKKVEPAIKFSKKLKKK